jgi:hypothetical protein
MPCGSGKTYGAALTGLLPGTAPTFAVAELDGSATRKIRLLRVVVSGIEATALAINDLRLTKLSSISTGGTATVPLPVPFDSAFPPATAIFRGFTVAPTGGGVALGAFASVKLTLPLVTTATPPPIIFDFATLPSGQRPTLHNAAEAIGIDLNGATPANAPNLDIYAWWTEEPLNA